MTPNILIATPTHKGEVAVEYMQSVMGLISALPQAKMSGGFIHRTGACIDVQRNWLASFFWAHEQFTHLLFIDDDMIFRPSAAFKLIQSGYDVCGCLCPAKQMELERYHRARMIVSHPNAARNTAQNYVASAALMRDDGGGKPGFIRTMAIGCGVTLISRRAIASMLEHVPRSNTLSRLDEFKDIPNLKEAIRFFDHTDDGDGTRLSEDLSFCRRWTGYCDGEIWACVDEEIGHIGRYVYRGKAADYINNGPLLVGTN